MRQMASRGKKPTKAGTVARCGILTALALVFSYIEALFPLPLGIPGIKLGLANLVVLSGLYLLPKKEVAAILIARIVLSGLLFGSMMSILYSLAGGIVSFLVMLAVKKTGRFSMVGVSILGGVFHNIGQLAAAVFVLSSPGLLYYFPALFVSGTLCGALVGVAAKRCGRAIKMKERA